MNISGVDDVMKNLQIYSKKIDSAVFNASNISAQLVRTNAIKSIQQRSPGKTVKRYRKSKSGSGSYAHVAASAGNAPNTDTGNLVRSAYVDIKGKFVFVGFNSNYAAALELGSTRMKARPFLIPAVEESRKGIMKAFSSEMRKATR